MSDTSACARASRGLGLLVDIHKHAESARQLATILREHAKSVSSKEKEKATTLLKKIIQYLVPALSLQV